MKNKVSFSNSVDIKNAYIVPKELFVARVFSSLKSLDIPKSAILATMFSSSNTLAGFKSK